MAVNIKRSKDQTDDGTTLLTLDEAAKRLRICKRTLQRLIREEKLKTVRVGRLVRIRPADLRRFIALHLGKPSDG